MSEPTIVQQRPDMDIQNDILAIIVQYPPTSADRHQIEVSVTDGQVMLKGHVKTPINRRYLINQIPAVSGVQSVDCSQLYDSETIRLEVGRRLPQGVIANVRFGTVVLTGELPENVNVEALAQSVANVPGVARVATSL